MRVVVTARAPCLPSRPLTTRPRAGGRLWPTTPTTTASATVPRGAGGGPSYPLPLLGGRGGGDPATSSDNNDNTNNANADDVAPPLLAPRSDGIAASATAAAAAETARLLMMPLSQQGGGRGSFSAAAADAAASAASDAEGVLSELVHLPVDCTELLGLRGQPSYLLCDVTRAYDALLGRAPDAPGGEADERAGEGFSDAALAGRVEVLELAKDAAVMAEGRVGGRAAPRWLGATYSAAAVDGGAGAGDNLAPRPPQPRSFAVPVHLLPAALVLLCQVRCETDLVADLAAQALQNWVVRAHFKRDLLLALALSLCCAARGAFDAGETPRGCAALEEALALLRNATGAAAAGSASPSGQRVAGGGGLGAAFAAFAAASQSLSSGSPQHGEASAAAAAPADQLPLAPRLAAEIEQALEDLEAPRVLEELRLLPLGDPARRRSVSALRATMQQQPQQQGQRQQQRQQQQQQGASGWAGGAGSGAIPAVTVDYARMAFALMGSEEWCEAADWGTMASRVAAAVRNVGGRGGGGGGSAGRKAARRYLAAAAPWLYGPSEALSTAAAAHLVAGFNAREPETVRLAAALAAAADVVASSPPSSASSSSSSSSSLSPSSTSSPSPYPIPVPPPASAESAVLRAAAAVLLGAVDDAVALLAAAQHLPSAGAWPSAEVQLAAGAASPAAELTDPSTGAPLLLPAEPQACWRFVRAQATAAGGDDDAPADQAQQQQQRDAHGAPAEVDPLPGLCVLTELWLSRLGFAAFPDTLDRPPLPALTAYFASPRVESLLERYAQEAEAAARAAAAASSRPSGGFYSSASSSFARAGRGSAALAVAAAARVAERVGRTVGRGLHAAQRAAAGAAASAALAPDLAPGAPRPASLSPEEDGEAADWVPPYNTRARIPASLPPPPPPPPAPRRPSAASSPSAALRRRAAEGAGAGDAALTPSRPSSPSAAAAAAAPRSPPAAATASFLASQRPRRRPTLAVLADLVAGGGAAVAAAASTAAASKGGKGTGTAAKARKLAAAAIGGAVLLAAAVFAARLASTSARSVAAAAAAAGSRSAPRPEHRVAAVAPAAGATANTAAAANPLSAALARMAFSASPASAQAGRALPPPSPVCVRVVGGPAAGRVLELTPRQAEALLRRWHDARAAALGPRYDAAALGPCAADPLLSAVAQRADRLEAEGWYLRLRATAPPRVTRLEAAGGAVLAQADVREAAALFSAGADGRRADGYSGAFSCEYRLVLCEDGAWRVADLTVTSGDDRGGGSQW